jgi:hypothetical protein
MGECQMSKKNVEITDFGMIYDGHIRGIFTNHDMIQFIIESTEKRLTEAGSENDLSEEVLRMVKYMLEENGYAREPAYE